MLALEFWHVSHSRGVWRSNSDTRDREDCSEDSHSGGRTPWTVLRHVGLTMILVGGRVLSVVKWKILEKVQRISQPWIQQLPAKLKPQPTVLPHSNPLRTRWAKTHMPFEGKGIMEELRFHPPLRQLNYSCALVGQQKHDLEPRYVGRGFRLGMIALEFR